MRRIMSSGLCAVLMAIGGIAFGATSASAEDVPSGAQLDSNLIDPAPVPAEGDVATFQQLQQEMINSHLRSQDQIQQMQVQQEFLHEPVSKEGGIS